jgi:hypothetical protein
VEEGLHGNDDLRCVEIEVHVNIEEVILEDSEEQWYK